MSGMGDLRPYPFEALVTRMFRELDRHGAIFDLPERKFVLGDPARDTSVPFHGRTASSPLGPAAGPQSQMAQNIVLSWLGGCRIMELKTVQVLDELKIPRPCIDMRTVGYNAEWSQELKLEESLEEYVKGTMLVEMLAASGKLPLAPGFDSVVYDMSVGYDLAGIRTAPVQAFLRGMRDASPVVARLRDRVPREFKTARDVPFRTDLSDSVTLSTFHGCPPGEIHAIIDFLLREAGVNCIIKFNPMLLGKEETLHLLHDVLGYDDVAVPDSAFERDATWDEAVKMVEGLAATALRLGLGLGVKFTNTLIVENRTGFLPAGEREVYLSGPPLHVLAMHLVDRFRRRFADRFPVSFSAGIDRHNFPDAVALGLAPVTVCTDLLKTGGYGRLRGYDVELSRRMAAAGARNIPELILRGFGRGAEALERLRPDPDVKAACLEALSRGSDARGAAGEDLYARWVSEAKRLNTESYVEAIGADPRYASARNRKEPPKIGRRLKLFDCVTCDKCVPACPNDANFTLGIEEREIPVVKARREGPEGPRPLPAPGRWTVHRGPPLSLAERHQIGVFFDFCNECGNCDIFCPEDGGPYIIKPRFFGSEEAWREARRLDGWFMAKRAGGYRIRGRMAGEEFEIRRGPALVEFRGDRYALRFDPGDVEGTLQGEGPREVDLTPYFISDWLARAVFDEGRLNYVNALGRPGGTAR
jgi:putative selenate reductase